MSLGSAIEDRMNAVSVDKLAGVKLTGHWYNPNSSNYVVELLVWRSTTSPPTHVTAMASERHAR
jgi:hypothetical protein